MIRTAWLVDIDYWLLSIGCWIFVLIVVRRLVTEYWLSKIHCRRLFNGHWVLIIEYWVLNIVHWIFNTICSVITEYMQSPIIQLWLLIMECWLLTMVLMSIDDRWLMIGYDGLLINDWSTIDCWLPIVVCWWVTADCWILFFEYKLSKVAYWVCILDDRVLSSESWVLGIG